MNNPIRNPHSLTRSRVSARLLVSPLLLAALATVPAQAGIQYGRDDWSNAVAVDVPVCTPGCTLSQTCTPLYDPNNPDDPGTNVCLNNHYPFQFMGNWQPIGRTHHVGDVVLDPATGAAYIFVDVTVPAAYSNFFTFHPPLTDPLSWQPFTGLVTSSQSGAPGEQGPAGPQGPQGPQGPKGDKGDPGAMGFEGAAGAMGPQGPKGDTGPMGLQGAAGAQGPKGDKGDTGPMGLQGATGAAGATGATGATGPKGDKGDTGPMGLQGATGLPGAQGPVGPTGAQGPTGLTGAQGLSGLPGAQGPKGDTGPQGATGAMGPQGLTGPAGPQGPAGAGLFSGAMVIVPVGVTIPAGYSCLPEKIRFRHEDEDDVDHHRARYDDDDSRWFRLCAKN